MDKPLNDDVLRRVDEGRREFIKKVVGGMAFAVPLMASFSMDGLTPAAEANGPVGFCSNQTQFPDFLSNQTNDPCCALAVCIAEEIDDFRDIVTNAITTHTITGAPTRLNLLLKSLSKALEFMNSGIESEDACSGPKAKSKFEYARGWMVNFLEVLGDLGLVPSPYSVTAEGIIADIDALLAGQCGTFKQPV
jgi:hypothetical protein